MTQGPSCIRLPIDFSKVFPSAPGDDLTWNTSIPCKITPLNESSLPAKGKESALLCVYPDVFAGMLGTAFGMKTKPPGPDIRKPLKRTICTEYAHFWNIERGKLSVWKDITLENDQILEYFFKSAVLTSHSSTLHCNFWGFMAKNKQNQIC